jgi:hypothetical protein
MILELLIVDQGDFLVQDSGVMRMYRHWLQRKEVFLPPLVLALASVLGVGSGCHSQAPESSNAHANWESVSVTMASTPLPSVHDITKEIGFAFVLPAYLPQGMSNTLHLMASPSADSPGGASPITASIALFPVDPTTGVWIDIDETPHNQENLYQDYPPSSQHVLINKTDVACWEEDTTPVSPTPTSNLHAYPRITCGWATEKIDFLVDFRWKMAKPTVTPEMRDEVMKVVTSMIEEPYFP